MKISIITCTRNSMRYLPQTVQSVQMQVGAECEHIFVDGNSTDGTIDYIKGLKGDVRILTGVEGGIARAMNAGIHSATGDVIAHLHSDDYYLEPTCLSLILSIFSETECRWLFGRIMSDVDGTLFSESYAVPSYSRGRFLRGNFIPHPATFIRREVFEECGLFSEDLRYAMDYDMFLRIAKCYPPQQLDVHLAAFRRHSGSATQANYMDSFKEDFKVRQRHAPLYGLPEAYLRYFVRRRRHMRRLNTND